jgi:hypothetical protein
MDCHSNETRWPWYSHVAPISWDVVADVARARKAMNLSEWAERTRQRPASEIGLLTAMCAGVQQDRMPLSKYRFLHPESRLTRAEKDALCAWTSSEVARHIERRRRTPGTASAQ